MKDNFFQDLVFYEKDNVTDVLFKKLERFCLSSVSNPDNLMNVSKAASSISTWIRAVYNYCSVLQTFKPKQLEIKEAENELKKVSILYARNFL